jgi:hypothetical protein
MPILKAELDVYVADSTAVKNDITYLGVAADDKLRSGLAWRVR